MYLTRNAAVNLWRFRQYKYTLNSASSLLPISSLGEAVMADVYAELQEPDTAELRLSHCAPELCPKFCGHALDSRISIEKMK